ncbi:TolC family protein [Pseudomonas sp. G34]|uniref:TolC family protein n=1 Tax=Pseudomonas sp. G34 TaxID=3059083 RepID=UPI0028077E94|nr:TolC family protein [Pseudomonas sp. G34]MDQ7985048.1 TolC family protein [Pseudomonas sp. G34]
MRVLVLALGCLALLACSSREPMPPAPLPAQAVAALPQAWWQSLQDPALDQLVALALRDNLDLATAAQRIREQRALRRQAAGNRYPNLNITGSHERGRSASEGHDEDYFYGLDLSWETDLFGRLGALQRAAEANLQAVRADYQALRVSLIAEVASTYLNYRLAQREVDIASRAADSQAQIARITRVRFDQGTASGFDVERLDTQVAITRAVVPQARQRAEAARYALAYLLNAEQSRIDALLAEQAQPLAPRDERLLPLLQLPASSLRARADVRAAELRLLAADSSLDAAQALRYPQLTLGALVGFEQGASVPAWTLSAQALQPLFDFGRIRAGIEAGDARREQAWLGYQASLVEALRETRSAISAYLEGLDRQRLLDTASRSAASATALAQRQYDAGTLSMIEVLDAQRTQFDTQLEQQRAASDVALRWVEIYRTLGLAPPEPAAWRGDAAQAPD